MQVQPGGARGDAERGGERGHPLAIGRPRGDPRLRRLYGLTRAEAHVALAVLRGDGLQAAADALGVTLATVKTHLQHVFGKTGTQRQTELMGLILAGSIGTVEG